ncbi:hypothetical protein C6P40_002383 [Pichia californica]|uniref:Protein-serine/threonine kinase n=1 Tax=Pichia californica TaxID=460514 RepID=A0A9P6WHT3_9ASCO|nr:hypothetical protein C6P40_002383 [[Candida] californica]
MFTRYKPLSRCLIKKIVVRQSSTASNVKTSSTSSSILAPSTHQHDLRLTMNKLIKNLSIQSLPDFQKTLKSNNDNNNNLNSNAEDTLRCLLILLAKRLERLSSLSFIMLMNPHMAKIWDAYLNSYNELIGFISKYSNLNEENIFKNIINFKFLNSNEQNLEFVKVLHDIMEMHTDNVIDLRDGIHEAKSTFVTTNSSYDDTSDETFFAGFSEKQFLDEHLSERVLMRLIANNFILLFENPKSNGILDKNLNVLDVLTRSIEFVNDLSNLKYYEKFEVIVNTRIIDKFGNYHIEENINLKNLKNHSKIIFPYIGNHIEYVLNEILKNSARAVIENNKNIPVKILIILDKSNFKNKTPTLQIKISDVGGGIKSHVLEKLWEYSFTTVNNSKSSSSNNNEIISTRSGKDVELGAAHDLGFGTSSGSEIGNNEGADTLVGDNIIAGMGYGLPLSLTYCRLFGGDIKLHTVWGYGTDVYVVLKGI